MNHSNVLAPNALAMQSAFEYPNCVKRCAEIGFEYSFVYFRVNIFKVLLSLSNRRHFPFLESESFLPRDPLATPPTLCCTNSSPVAHPTIHLGHPPPRQAHPASSRSSGL